LPFRLVPEFRSCENYEGGGGGRRVVEDSVEFFLVLNDYDKIMFFTWFNSQQRLFYGEKSFYILMR